MVGRPRSLLQSVIWKKALRTIAFPITPCPLNNSLDSRDFGPEGTKSIRRLLSASFLSRLSVTSLFCRYDVYTPTRNIVFHDYGDQTNGHGANEWFKRQRDRFRQASILRAKTLLQLPIQGGETDVNAQANLGIYGLGKRRSLDQLGVFAHVDLKEGNGNMGPGACTGHEWVQYDSSILPTENLFTNPSNLDPQPEYPRRTKLLYYQQVQQFQPLFEVDTESAERELPAVVTTDGHEIDRFDAASGPSVGVFFVFWIFGLLVWYMLFAPNAFAAGTKPRRTTSHKKGTHQYKDV
jgi:hypothetical protein